MNEPIKHGGCHDCKLKEQPVLKSVSVKGEIMSIALCDKCIEKRGIVIDPQYA